MATPLPFSISPEAADYMRSVMRRPLAGEELALITVHRQAEMVGVQERFSFDGEHFMICFYDVGRRPQAEHIELLGYRVSIVQSTLSHCAGARSRFGAWPTVQESYEMYWSPPNHALQRTRAHWLNPLKHPSPPRPHRLTHHL